MASSTPSRRFGWLDRMRIRQCVGSVKLPCGCQVGRYLGYSDELIEILEEHAAGCSNPLHAVDAVIAPSESLTHQSI